jgi:hypothetical protein
MGGLTSKAEIPAAQSFKKSRRVGTASTPGTAALNWLITDAF